MKIFLFNLNKNTVKKLEQTQKVRTEPRLIIDNAELS